MDSFGNYLRCERELREIPISEIAEVTKIKLEYLKAIEVDKFDALPNKTFVKGYIRAYAKYCGLNEDEALINYEFFIQQQGKDDSSMFQTTDKTEEKRGKSSSVWKYLLLLLLIVLFSFLFAYFLPIIQQ